MCGRYTLTARRQAVAAALGLDDFFELPPRYNIAPTQWVPTVRLDPDGGGPELSALKWGLIPPWIDEPGIANRLINARAETVAERPAFRSAFRRRRCLIVADGFYEWDRRDGRRPYYFRLNDGRPFAFAGLWERWDKGDEPVESCTLITTAANGVVAPVHDRMPVILRPEDHARWLDPGEHRPAALAGLLVPPPDDWLVVNPVSRRVNNPRNEGPRCIERARLDAPTLIAFPLHPGHGPPLLTPSPPRAWPSSSFGTGNSHKPSTLLDSHVQAASSPLDPGFGRGGQITEESDDLMY
jgi:putative SOS response-associated peptidase YedK